MSSFRLLAWSVLFACAFFAVDSPAVGTLPARTIVIDGTAFAPEAVTVKRGDAVLWVNKDPFPHTVTAEDGAFDSKTIESGSSWEYIANTPGEFRYTCTFHSTMKAILKVE
jgi:plastocyanin